MALGLFENPTYVWWVSLCVVTFIEAVLFTAFARRETKVPYWAKFCLVAFALGAHFRSVVPVRWATRPHGCLYESPYRILGGDMLDRFVAQTAEVSLGALVAFTSGTHLDTLGLSRMAALARFCVWPIVLAQCCCWVGEISDNKLWHVFEESLWGSTFSVHALLAAAAWLTTASWSAEPTGKGRSAAAVKARSFLLILGLLCLPYVHFMFTVDVPMYHEQWRTDEAKGTIYDGWGPGLRRMLTCHDVADDWLGWSEDALWMSLYFGVGPIAARALAGSLRAAPP